jgi:galactonate dehydratase
VKIAGLKTFVVAAPRGGNWVFVELFGGPWRYEVVQTTHEVADGSATLPSVPGLGVELNEAEAAKHPYVADFRNHDTFADGSVADA